MAPPTLVTGLVAAIVPARLEAPVVVVLEGAARQGAQEREQAGLRIVHAPRSGDDAIVDAVAQAVAVGDTVTLVTADRELRCRAEAAGSTSVGPSWLLDRLEDVSSS
jgi:hypothetical protein